MKEYDHFFVKEDYNFNTKIFCFYNCNHFYYVKKSNAYDKCMPAK